MEKAVNWKWTVERSDPSAWGLSIPIPEPTPVLSGTSTAPALNPDGQASTYEIKRGDALVIIAKKFHITVQQLKLYNGLTSDIIRVGDTLNIPTKAEAERLAPTPLPPEKKPAKPGQPQDGDRQEMETAAIQAFLDREGFSSGSISGKATPVFGKTLYLYQSTRPGMLDAAAFSKKVHDTVGTGFTTYKLQAIDYRFIAPPAAAKADGTSFAVATPTPTPAKGKGGKVLPPKPVAERAKVSYDSMVRQPMLAYNTPWEFVAERFHCDEAFLRRLNEHIKTVPTVGTEFRVPNVAPFAIEEVFTSPLQPQAGGQPAVTASVLDGTFLQIMRGDELVAVMPISSARPGLRGKGTWTVMGVIPRPRLATLQEEKERPARPTPPYGRPAPEASATPVKKLASPEYLGAGPNNPVGIIWIDLAKADSPDPLPYGLHGTSIPDEMMGMYSLGGFQMTNWDIVRAARLMPPGTPLEWKQSGAITPAGGTAVPAAAPVAQPVR